METDAQTDVAGAEKQANLEKVSNYTKGAQRPTGRAEESGKGRAGSIREARETAKPLASNKHLAGCPETVRLGLSGAAQWRGEIEEKGHRWALLSADQPSAQHSPALCCHHPSRDTGRQWGEAVHADEILWCGAGISDGDHQAVAEKPTPWPLRPR